MATSDTGRLVPLVRRGQRPWCVMIAGAGGGIMGYLRLARVLGESGNVVAVQAAGLVDGGRPEDRVEQMADSTLRALDDAGITPALVFGWSMGGTIGWELCVRLAARGVRPDLAMLDSSPLPHTATAADDERLTALVLGMLGPRPGASTRARVQETLNGQLRAVAAYRATRPYDGRVLLVTCADVDPGRAPSVAAWRSLAPHLRTTELAAGHYEALAEAHLAALVAALAPVLPARTAERTG